MTMSFHPTTPSTTDASLIDLTAMLQFKRPAYSPVEKEFNRKFLLPLGCKPDKMGNLFLTIGNHPNVLWSSHTDTVHKDYGWQNIQLDGDYIKLARSQKKKPSNCLGADCTAGIWIMREMIKAKVPGVYIFHAAEEIGGRGSRYIANDTPIVLDGIDFAVAFDRRGVSDIITHQAGERGASDEFANSIKPQLPVGYAASRNGIFTDTANYSALIAECTNLSVGYFDEHTKEERLFLPHILMLKDAMLEIDTTKFVSARDKTKVEYDDWGDDIFGFGTSTTSTDARSSFWRTYNRYVNEPKTLEQWVRANPSAADLLDQLGITLKDAQGY